MTFDRFDKLVTYVIQTGSEHMRRGQHLFNLLNYVRPDLASSIRTTRIDPYYLDEKVVACLEWLKVNWDKE